MALLDRRGWHRWMSIRWAVGVSGPTGGALVASGSSQSYIAAFNTGTLGMQTQTFSLNVGDDHTLAGASAPSSISTTATLTVLDHSNASLSSTASQTTETINFGNVLRGANVPSQTFTIYNLAANTSAAYTANMELTGFTTSGDPALDHESLDLQRARGGHGNTFTASLNTSNYTTTGITHHHDVRFPTGGRQHVAGRGQQQQRGASRSRWKATWATPRPTTAIRKGLLRQPP